MSSVINYVQPKNKLAKDLKIAEIIKVIEEKTESIIHKHDIKLDPEFITYLLNLVENLVSSKFTKEEKITIVTTFLKKHFEISDTELNIITGIIHFVIDNKQIKKIHLSKKIWHFISNFTKSK